MAAWKRWRGGCAAWCAGLPVGPPSFVAARVLDRLLWPRLDASQRTLLRHRCIEIESVGDRAVRVRLVLGERGFEVARAASRRWW